LKKRWAPNHSHHPDREDHQPRGVGQERFVAGKRPKSGIGRSKKGGQVKEVLSGKLSWTSGGDMVWGEKVSTAKQKGEKKIQAAVKHEIENKPESRGAGTENGHVFLRVQEKKKRNTEIPMARVQMNRSSAGGRRRQRGGIAGVPPKFFGGRGNEGRLARERVTVGVNRGALPPKLIQLGAEKKWGF